jgi:hypothetical protein
MMNTLDQIAQWDAEEAALVLQIARRLWANNRVADLQAAQEAAAEIAVTTIARLDREIDRICTADLDD